VLSWAAAPIFLFFRARIIAFFAARKNNIAPEIAAKAVVYNLGVYAGRGLHFKCVFIGGLWCAGSEVRRNQNDTRLAYLV
jgi:hypothetical protein